MKKIEYNPRAYRVVTVHKNGLDLRHLTGKNAAPILLRRLKQHLSEIKRN